MCQKLDVNVSSAYNYYNFCDPWPVATVLLASLQSANLMTVLKIGSHSSPLPMVRMTPVSDQMAGCPVHELRAKLRKAGLRPTRQRVALGWMLFGKGDRHVTAERLYEEATGSRIAISLATVYNTLHQFTEAGLLREIAVDGAKTWFDTNLSTHHHFLIEETNTIFDIPGQEVSFARLPEPPEGMEIDRVDVVIRLRKKKG
jgi:Fur family transcriptional regulator, iron response regulator